MKKLDAEIFFGLIFASFLGCAWWGTPEKEDFPISTCEIRTVFAGDTTPAAEGAKDKDEFWVRVEAELSDSSFDFGYINDRGNFIRYFNGARGAFEALGGLYYPFALRATSLDRSVYCMDGFGTCELTGETIDASNAVQPPLKKNYRSGLVIVFSTYRQGDVTVHLSVRSPNGFTYE